VNERTIEREFVSEGIHNVVNTC